MIEKMSMIEQRGLTSVSSRIESVEKRGLMQV
jgi:hypothetical protein